MSILVPKFPTPHGSQKDCYIVIGNHTSYHGIGEVIYSLEAFFSQRYNTTICQYIVPGQINVIIDDFSNPELVNVLKECKHKNPDTHFIILATEFITNISLFGISFGKTFNFFRPLDNPRQFVKLIAWKLGLVTPPPYLHARYLGFVSALEFVDLILCAHPHILDTMKLIPEALANLPAVPMTLYPEIDYNSVAHDTRLFKRPFGFVMSGTMTKYRSQIIGRLLQKFYNVGYYQALYKYKPFSQSPCFSLDGNEADYGYGDEKSETGSSTKSSTSTIDYIFNINPPQHKHWGYSSPMRILRAILMGHIPVVTRKYGDHALEDVAFLFNDSLSSIRRMIVDATVNRKLMVDAYLETLANYNSIAHKKNAPIRDFLDAMDRTVQPVHLKKHSDNQA